MGKRAGRSTLPSLIPFIEWIAGVCPHVYFAVTGFDDARPAEPDDGGNPRFRASRSAAAENLRRVEDQLVKACAALKCPPSVLLGETQTRLDRLCEAAAVELGMPMSKDEARLRAEYDLTLREITLRLRNEKEGAGLKEQVPSESAHQPCQEGTCQ